MEKTLILRVFSNNKKILNEYHENCSNANTDCSAYLNFKEEAQKPESTTHSNREWNNPSIHSRAVHEKVFKKASCF